MEQMILLLSHLMVLLKARVGASLEKKRLRDTEESYLDRVETDKKRSHQILKLLCLLRLLMNYICHLESKI